MRSAAAYDSPLQRLAGGFRRPELLGGAGTACANFNNYAGTPSSFLPLLPGSIGGDGLLLHSLRLLLQ
jgi:hypothetical protein